MNAKGMADAVQSIGHTLAQGDLVELTVVKGKAFEIKLFDGIPSETETRVMKYEGVGHDGKNPSFVKATDADLAATGKYLAGAGEGEASAGDGKDDYANYTILKETVDKILKTEQGKRPNPKTYIPEDYIRYHLDKFKNGVVKVAGETPQGTVGPETGTFVFPKDFVNEMIRLSDGKTSKLETLLGLTPGTLKDDPVLISILDPIGLRMPSGNERGANDFWKPGGKTSGDIWEAVIDQLQPGNYTISKIFK